MKSALFFFIFLFLLLIVNSLIGAIRTSLTNDHALSSLMTNVQQAQQTHDFLAQQLQYVKTTHFVEEEARNKLGMVKPGEHIIIAPPPPTQKLTTQTLPDPNWKKWLKLFF